MQNYYSYTNYNSNYRPSYSSPRNNKQYNTNKSPKRKTHKFRNISLFLLLVIVFGAIYVNYKSSPNKQIEYHSASSIIKSTGTIKTTKPKTNGAIATKTDLATANVCSDNTYAQNVIVIINYQHLWACAYNKAVFNSPVVTGYSGYAADITPVGVYHIFNKYTNVNLTGSDQLGSWNVHVDYWMPFLFNQYGAYGLHDANWVKPSQFGQISPSSKLASHGCVELPTPSAEWIYDWIKVGSTVTIQQAI